MMFKDMVLNKHLAKLITTEHDGIERYDDISYGIHLVNELLAYDGHIKRDFYIIHDFNTWEHVQTFVINCFSYLGFTVNESKSDFDNYTWFFEKEV